MNTFLDLKTLKNDLETKASKTIATTSTDGLMDKNDKSKLDNIANNANNYVHPSNHPASIITQDANNRFVTDEEKMNWNNSIANITNLTTIVNNAQLSKMTGDTGACRSIPNNNANDINVSGFWMGSNVINVPAVKNTWVYIESFIHNANYQSQICIDLHSSGIRWVRHKTSGNWSPWKKIYTEDVRPYSWGTGDPSGGVSGDLYFKYS